ncbi:MAG: hypothetical protein Fur0021_06930 [Candidatus Promineifilaceae bacterium]
MTQRRALFWMFACLLLAALLRLPALPQIPPGLHYDAAANVTLAGDIGLRGARPVFISSYTGKEVLFFYLAGGVVRLVGESAFSLRLTTALIGLLTIAAAYRVGRELLRDRRVALLAAALLAVSFWHLLFSRLGFRAISQPLLQALTVAALWRGLRLAERKPAHFQTWIAFASAGIFLGLTAYTYLAARLFPVLLGLALLPVLRRRWRHLLLSGGAALLVLLPLLNYFRLHPDAFWVRIQQVGSSDSLTLGQSLLKSLGMFFVRGDPYWRFNLPDRPLFSWVGGALLLAGAALLARQARGTHGWQQGAALLLLLAPLVMLLPTALAVNEIVPSNLRAIGMLPFLYLLPAFSLAALLDHIPIRLPRHSLDVLLFLLLAAGGSLTYHAYFQQWAQRADVFYENDADLAAAAAYLDAAAQPQETLFVAALHYRHPTVAALSRQYERIKWLPGSAALVFPAHTPARILFPHSSPMPAWAAPLLADASLEVGPSGPDGEPLYTVYTLTAAPPLSMAHPLNLNLGNAITLLGYEVEPAASGSALPLTLYWQVQSAPPIAFAPFVHLEDAWGYRWSQVEPNAYPSEQWTAGDWIVQRVDVPLPAGMPAGDYQLRVGLFNQETGERLPQLDAAGRYAGSAALISPIPIQTGPPPAALPTPPFPVNQTVPPGLTLYGYERGSAAAQSGERLQLAFWWLANAALPSGWELRVTLTDLTRQVWTLQQGQPVHDSYPFPQWQPPLFLIDRQTVSLPPDLPTGDYELAIQLLDSRGAAIFSQPLGPLQVTAANRLFQPPPIAQQLDARFGDEISLLGYNLDGENLTLVWQALAAPAADYTVFVHLLDAQGVCCLWQQDAWPQQGNYATTRWLPGEVVLDTYAIPLKMSAGYTLEIGLYIAETGHRLQVVQPNTPPSDAILLPWSPP